jgi:orotate phosphoribosyltransferase-like protein
LKDIHLLQIQNVSVKLIALSEAGLKPSRIARQLNLNYETVKKHLYRKKLVDGSPPKVKVKKVTLQVEFQVLFVDTWRTTQ